MAAAVGEEYDATRKLLSRMADAGLIQRSQGLYSLVSVSDLSGLGA
jgi:hypothetical protein